MSVVQYIGARYVPIWYTNSVDGTANWEVNVEYEPLTWVTTPNNHLYLSKKTVPDNIGTPAQNTEYWLDVGTMNGNYQDLQDQINEIISDIGDLDDLQTTDKSSIVNAINEVLATAGAVNSRYMIFQGDSYSIPNAYGGNSWAQNAAAYLGLTSSDYLLLDNDGAGFDDPGAYTNETFQQQLESNVVTDHTVTHIVVAAGANDRNKPIADVRDAVAAYIAKAKQLYPKAKIYIACIGWSKTASYAQEIMNVSYPAYKETAIEHGAIWLESPTNCLLFGNDFQDYLHPTPATAVIMGRAIANGVNDHEDAITRDNTVNIVAATGYSLNQGLSMIVKQRGDMMTCEIASTGDTYSTLSHSAQTVSNSSWMHIMDLADSINAGHHIEWTSELFLSNGNDVFQTLATFRILGSEIYVKAHHGMAGVTSMGIYATAFTYPVRNNLN